MRVSSIALFLLLITSLSSHALVGPSFGSGGSGSSAASSTSSGASTDSTRQGGTSEKEGKKNPEDDKTTAPEGPQSKSEQDKIADEIKNKYAKAFNGDDLKTIADQKIAEANAKYGLKDQKVHGIFEPIDKGKGKDIIARNPELFQDAKKLNPGPGDMVVGKLTLYNENGEAIASDIIHGAGWGGYTPQYVNKEGVWYLGEPYAKEGSMKWKDGQVYNATMRLNQDPNSTRPTPYSTERLHIDSGWKTGSAFGTAGCWGTQNSITQFVNASYYNGKQVIPVYVANRKK